MCRYPYRCAARRPGTGVPVHPDRYAVPVGCNRSQPAPVPPASGRTRRSVPGVTASRGYTCRPTATAALAAPHHQAEPPPEVPPAVRDSCRPAKRPAHSAAQLARAGGRPAHCGLASSDHPVGAVQGRSARNRCRLIDRHTKHAEVPADHPTIGSGTLHSTQTTTTKNPPNNRAPSKIQRATEDPTKITTSTQRRTRSFRAHLDG